MIELKDQMNRTIRLEKFPERIVSLVPSQTELLFDLGLGDRVVGITKFCIHPNEWYKTKTRVGGTKNLHLDVIEKLQPDLIIGNKEENTQGDIDALEKKYPVYMSDIFAVEDALQMIADIGDLTGKDLEAKKIAKSVKHDFDSFTSQNKSVLYLIWAEPFMAAGEKTFIGDVIRKIGLTNCIHDSNARYPELSLDQITELNPDFIFLSSEPFPFNESHAEKIAGSYKGRIEFVDGELFSWYGSRMQRMKAYFTSLFQRLKDTPQ
jgi:ABC-type Fe3+-hydroxamate transport system substrate-binding protein